MEPNQAPTLQQRQYWAWELLRQAASGSVESLAGTLVDAQVDLNPHQVEAALFACQNPLAKGVILADEVGLGKTIEAGLVIAQRWAERRRRILIIVPANLRKQWYQELLDKFGLESLILETKSYNALRKEGAANPFEVDRPVKGDGGFRYYRLAPSLLERDRWGNWVISREYDAPMLAQAVCKLQGFTYAPSDMHWWQHGHASERDFICVTTQTLSAAQLQALAEDVGPQRSLLVLCGAWHGVTAAQAAERWPSLTLKKIPKTVLSSCEWGHDDYSLNVANLPMAEQAQVQAEPAPGVARTARKARAAGGAATVTQPGLFGDDPAPEGQA